MKERATLAEACRGIPGGDGPAIPETHARRIDAVLEAKSRIAR